jgi:hypothetical protein
MNDDLDAWLTTLAPCAWVTGRVTARRPCRLEAAVQIDGRALCAWHALCRAWPRLTLQFDPSR